MYFQHHPHITESCRLRDLEYGLLVPVIVFRHHLSGSVLDKLYCCWYLVVEVDVKRIQGIHVTRKERD